ncbi:MAG TPA: hypothetical protein DEQ02_09760 [Ruminococcaceae bacterium]|nr:hypothetical protein [Oscillospiraceae bacterium]
MRKIKSVMIGVLILFMLFSVSACADEDTATGSQVSQQSSQSWESGEMPPFTEPGANGSRTGDKVGFQFEMPQKGEEIAVLHTDMGVIKIRLFPQSAPVAVENFRQLVAKGYYAGVIFHRVIKDFMIQGGDPQGTGMGGESAWGKSFGYEFNKNLLHFGGALSMAHSQQPDSNGSQFFIVQAPPSDDVTASIDESVYEQGTQKLYAQHGGTPWLDGAVNPDGHTVFGQVFDGMDIVNKIAEVAVDANAKPLTDVVIQSIELATY